MCVYMYTCNGEIARLIQSIFYDLHIHALFLLCLCKWDMSY